MFFTNIETFTLQVSANLMLTNFFYQVWDADTGSILLTFKGHCGDVNCCTFCPTDSNLIATCSSDNTIKVLNLCFLISPLAVYLRDVSCHISYLYNGRTQPPDWSV